MEQEKKKEILRNGLGIISYCRAHERTIDDALEAGRDPAALLAWHEKKLAWLQHERLVHFLVTMLTAAAFMFALAITLWLQYGSETHESPLVAFAVSAVLLVLFICYLVHYFRLENTVQLWLAIAEELHEKCSRAAD